MNEQVAILLENRNKILFRQTLGPQNCPLTSFASPWMNLAIEGTGVVPMLVLFLLECGVFLQCRTHWRIVSVCKRDYEKQSNEHLAVINTILYPL